MERRTIAAMPRKLKDGGGGQCAAERIWVSRSGSRELSLAVVSSARNPQILRPRPQRDSAQSRGLAGRSLSDLFADVLRDNGFEW
jgi:hypothetical protein